MFMGLRFRWLLATGWEQSRQKKRKIDHANSLLVSLLFRAVSTILSTTALDLPTPQPAGLWTSA